MNIPPSFNFSGNKDKAISLKGEANSFNRFISMQAELGGIPFLHRTKVLSDGSVISVTTRKGEYDLRTSVINIIGAGVTEELITSMFTVSRYFPDTEESTIYPNLKESKNVGHYHSGIHYWTNPKAKGRDGCISWRSGTIYVDGQYKVITNGIIIACEIHEYMATVIYNTTNSSKLYVARLEVKPRKNTSHNLEVTIKSNRLLREAPSYIAGIDPPSDYNATRFTTFTGGFLSKRGFLYIREGWDVVPAKIYEYIFNDDYSSAKSKLLLEDKVLVGYEGLIPFTNVYGVPGNHGYTSSRNGRLTPCIVVHSESVDIAVVDLTYSGSSASVEGPPAGYTQFPNAIAYQYFTYNISASNTYSFKTLKKDQFVSSKLPTLVGSSSASGTTQDGSQMNSSGNDYTLLFMNCKENLLLVKNTTIVWTSSIINTEELLFYNPNKISILKRYQNE